MFFSSLAAVCALAKFGAASDELLPNILILLQRTMFDQDDEVRDRATFYHQLLKQNDRGLYSAYILNCKSREREKQEIIYVI